MYVWVPQSILLLSIEMEIRFSCKTLFEIYLWDSAEWTTYVRAMISQIISTPDEFSWVLISSHGISVRACGVATRRGTCLLLVINQSIDQILVFSEEHALWHSFFILVRLRCRVRHSEC